MGRPERQSHCFSPGEPRRIQTLPHPQELKTTSSWAGPAPIPLTFVLCCSLDECTWTDTRLSGQEHRDLVSAQVLVMPRVQPARGKDAGSARKRKAGRQKRGGEEQLVKSTLKICSKPIINGQAPDERVLWGMNGFP